MKLTYRMLCISADDV